MDQLVARFDEAHEGFSPGSLRPGATPLRRRLRLRSLLIGLGVLALLAGAGRVGHDWWTTGRFLASTEDAYLQADNVIISPRIPGYISEVDVTDNQPVRTGQVLARIDDRDYHTAVTAAQAELDAQAANIDNLGQQIQQQQSVIAEARASVAADRASLLFAQQDFARYSSLSKTGAATEQNAQQATSALQEKQATLDHDVAALGAAEKQISVLHTQVEQARAMLAQKQAALHQTQLNESYTTITASVAGTVGARTLRVGQYVQAGTQLMAVVPLRHVYVVANYKETQLTDVHSGQPVTLDVDTFPGQVVHGVVDSIAPASGQEFALLPPDNATGNFTKIVQRVPVKIDLDPHDPLIGRLRPGMSVVATIDTRKQED